VTGSSTDIQSACSFDSASVYLDGLANTVNTNIVGWGTGGLLSYQAVASDPRLKFLDGPMPYGITELVAAVAILSADAFGLPVSTTHILSSGVAGTMAANGSGLQWSTIRSIALAWVLTLPAAMMISGTLYYLLRQLV
jgi:PiT family inorganic phosphate transporter